jgi:hypothetical protein
MHATARLKGSFQAQYSAGVTMLTKKQEKVGPNKNAKFQ